MSGIRSRLMIVKEVMPSLSSFKNCLESIKRQSDRDSVSMRTVQSSVEKNKKTFSRLFFPKKKAIEKHRTKYAVTIPIR